MLSKPFKEIVAFLELFGTSRMDGSGNFAKKIAERKNYHSAISAAKFAKSAELNLTTFGPFISRKNLQMA